MTSTQIPLIRPQRATQPPRIHPEHPSLSHPADALLDTMEGVGTLDLVAEGLAPDPKRCGAPVVIWSASVGGCVRYCDKLPHLHDTPGLTSHDHMVTWNERTVRVPAKEKK